MYTAVQETAGGIEALMERMKRLTEEAQEEMTPEELLKTFERVETQSAERKCTTPSRWWSRGPEYKTSMCVGQVGILCQHSGQ